MLKDLKKFYKNKRIFITGNTGFKGSWLTMILNSFKSNLCGYSLNENFKPSMYELLNLKSKIKLIKGDVRNFQHLNKSINKFKPDIIFHLAAQSLVHKSYIDPLFTVSTNTGGSANILESCRLSKSLKSLVYITSDKCYENVEWIWGYRENDKLGGYDAYSSSKAAAENIFSAYLESFFKNKKLGAVSVRAGNVIGGGDWSENRIIPDIIKSIENKKKIIIRNPKSTRPWQHVLDPLLGYLILGMKAYNNNNFSGSYNFGPNNDAVLTVRDVVNQMSKRLNIKKKNILFNNKKSKFKEANLLKLNCDKAKDRIRWYPKISSKMSIDLACDWYKSYFEKKNMTKVTELQIQKFLKKYEK